jgi:hypothetical protein
LILGIVAIQQASSPQSSAVSTLTSSTPDSVLTGNPILDVAPDLRDLRAHREQREPATHLEPAPHLERAGSAATGDDISWTPAVPRRNVPAK